MDKSKMFLDGPQYDIACFKLLLIVVMFNLNFWHLVPDFYFMIKISLPVRLVQKKRLVEQEVAT